MWIAGSPRINEDVVPKEQPEKNKGNLVEMDVHIDGETNMLQEEAASLIDAFWGHAYTECNSAKANSCAYTSTVAKPDDKAFTAVGAATGPRIHFGRQLKREMPSLESLSYGMMRHCLFGCPAELTHEEEDRRL